MKQFAIREDLAIAIGQYLAQRPYAEVVGLINGLQAIRELEPPKSEKDSEKPAKG